jgi:hypothetical protein
MKFRDLLQDLLEEQLPCEKVVTYDMLNRAKNWWLNRLTNDPSIVSKILETKYGKPKLQKMDKNSVFKLIDNTSKDIITAVKRINSVNKLEYFSMSGSEVMHVNETKPTVVFVNCQKVKGLTNEINYGALIHELQHIIHDLIGVDSLTVVDTGNYRNYIDNSWDTKEILKLSTPKSSWYENAKKYVLNVLGSNDRQKGGEQKGDEYFTKEYAKRKYNEYSKDGRYMCDTNETQSRMAQVRSMLNLKPNQDITIDMLRDPEVYWIFWFNLLCWGSRTDNVSLQDYLNNLNLLVSNKKQNTSTQV